MTTLPFVWDDESVRDSDWRYIQELAPQLLLHLEESLNSFHGVQYSRRFWQVLVGAWVERFTQVVVERRRSLLTAHTAHAGSALAALSQTQMVEAPPDTETFARAMTTSAWNQLLTERIAAVLDVPVHRVPATQHHATPKTLPSRQEGSLRSYLVQAMAPTLANVLPSRARLHVYNSGFGVRDASALALTCGGLPFSLPRNCQTTDQHRKQSPQARMAVSKGAVAGSVLGLLISLLPDYLPLSYLESFDLYASCPLTKRWPRSPRGILTANAFYTDDVWKHWAARAIESGSKLVISQHGGHYGIGARSSMLDFEHALADTFITWGWSDAEYPRAKPGAAGRLARLRERVLDHEPSQGLLVLGSVPRWTYWTWSAPLGPQYRRCLNDQVSFLEALNEEVRREFHVRLPSEDYGWGIKEMLATRVPGTSLLDANGPLPQVARNQKLVVVSYNGTAFLEILAINVPTQIFWNPLRWEIHPRAQGIFKRLNEVGVFFSSGTDCGKHVNLIWDSVDSWWDSDPVQDALLTFRETFVSSPHHMVRDTKAIIQTTLHQPSVERWAGS